MTRKRCRRKPVRSRTCLRKARQRASLPRLHDLLDETDERFEGPIARDAAIASLANIPSRSDSMAT